jgi:hypothetical protein
VIFKEKNHSANRKRRPPAIEITVPIIPKVTMEGLPVGGNTVVGLTEIPPFVCIGVGEEDMVGVAVAVLNGEIVGVGVIIGVTIGVALGVAVGVAFGDGDGVMVMLGFGVMVGVTEIAG